MSARPARLITAGALVGALVLAGCSADSEKGNADGPNQGTSSGESADSSPSTDDPDAKAAAEEAAKAGIDPANPPKPIASVTTAADVEGDPKATVKIDLLSLKRDGKAVIAAYAFTVNAAEGASDEPRWIYHYLGGDAWSPTLVDTKNLKLHKVLQSDSDVAPEKAQTDSQGVKFKPGQTVYAYAMFAAPPEDVTKMDVVMGDNVPAIPNVPLS